MILLSSGISRVPGDSCHLSKAGNPMIGQARGVVHLLALFHRWAHILAHLQGLEARCVEAGVGQSAHFLWRHRTWRSFCLDTLMVNSGVLEFVTVVCPETMGCGSALEVCLVYIRPRFSHSNIQLASL